MANWLLEIGMPYDPLPDEGERRVFFAQCKKEWGLVANKGERGLYYNAMLERIDSISEEAEDAGALERLAAEAREISYPVIDQLVEQALEADGSLDEAKIAAIEDVATDMIAEKAGLSFVKLPEGLVASRAAVAGEGGTGKGGGLGLFREVIGKKPAGSHKYRSFEEDLGLFDAANLFAYAFDSEGDQIYTANVPADEVCERAAAKEQAFQKGTSKRSAAERLSARAAELAKTPGEWEKYLDYLRWRDSKQVLDRVVKVAALSNGVVSARNARSAVRRLAVIQGSPERAQLLLEGCCESQQPPLFVEEGAGDDELLEDGGLAPQPVAGAGRVAAAASELTGVVDSGRLSQQLRGSGDAPSSAAVPKPEPADLSGFDFRTCPNCKAQVGLSIRFCTVCGADLEASSRQGEQVAAQRKVVQQVVRQDATQVIPATAVPVVPATPCGQSGRAVRVGQVETKKKSRAPIAVLVVVLVLFAAAAIAFAALQAPSCSSQDSADAPVVVADGGAVDCSATTTITPRLANGDYLAKYKVELNLRPSMQSGNQSNDQIMQLNVEGDGGFTMNNFVNYGAELSTTAYEVVVTDYGTNVEYHLTINYNASNLQAPAEVELQCG